MLSSKCEYLRTHIIEKVESVKTSDSGIYSDEEEEQLVARVEGRGRSLVQALFRIRRERERAGSALQNLQLAPDVRMRPQLQEVGPCGWEVERRLGGLQAWGSRNQTINALGTTDTPDYQQTVSKERPRTRVRTRVRPGTPLTHPDFPIVTIPLLWGTLWPPQMPTL